MSIVPFGAKLRVGSDGEAEYLSGGRWRKATGKNGDVTKAWIRFKQRDGERITGAENDDARRAFFDPDTNDLLSDEWKNNDFGRWSWNMMKGGKRTVYYIHTTPQDEKATAENRPFRLEQSHGCVHIRPADRDKMMRLGYLRAGIPMEVKPYGLKGPP
jgi:hypothetical protein